MVSLDVITYRIEILGGIAIIKQMMLWNGLILSAQGPLLDIINTDIQMKQKELTETFMMISNWKNPLVYSVYANTFQRCEG